MLSFIKGEISSRDSTPVCPEGADLAPFEVGSPVFSLCSVV